jgi:regulator of replication initiation timing
MRTMIREIREEIKALRKELAAMREENGEIRKELATVREEKRGREEKGQAEKANWMKTEKEENDRGKDGTKRKEGEEE